MIKVGILSDDVGKQIEVLKEFPDLAEKHYRPVLKKDVKVLEGEIEPNIPTLSGRAQNTFGSKVTGKGFGMKGQAGWYDKSDPWYPNVLEYGAKAHDITVKPQSSQVLTWGNGAFSKGHTIHHPGLSARGFMAAGYSAIQPIVERDFEIANERIIADLAAI